MHTVYKVVRKIPGGRFISAVIDTPGYQLEYKIGEETHALPNSVGVLVFKNLKQARNWNYIENPLLKVILRCETEDAPQRVHSLASYFLVDRAIAVFAGKKASWKRRLRWVTKDFAKAIFYCSVPIGTYAVRSVTPVKVVQ